MRAGVAAPQIESQLVARGLDPASTAIVVRNLSAARTNALRAAGKRNMPSGALWCIGGLLVTALTYSAARQGGSTYVITWGAIIFGAIQFLRGLGQYLQNQGVPSAATSSAGGAVIDNVDPWDAARPRVQPRTLMLLGVIALVVVGGILLFANAGSSGVKTSAVVTQATAADINLKADDLGSGFSLTEELGQDKLTDQGSSQAFTFSTAGGKGKGHVLAFIKGDCIVMLMQAGAESQVSAEKLQVYAHAIESRIR